MIGLAFFCGFVLGMASLALFLGLFGPKGRI